MKNKIKYIAFAMLCVVAVLATGCTAAKTVTVAQITQTQWIAGTTVTQNSTITLPASTQTVTLPAVTNTVTQPAVTSTVTEPAVTNTVTQPAITVTVTSTVTPTPTTTLTPSEAISVSLLPLLGGNVLDIDENNDTTDQIFYVVLHYDNAANVNYNNVKFNITLYSDLLVGDFAADGLKIATVGGVAPYFIYAGNSASGYLFISTPNMVINANAENDIMLVVTVKLAAVTAKSAYLFPSIAIG